MKISHLIAAGFASLLLLSESAYAYDASLTYRNYPGFQCYQWNSRGECVNFSYSASGTTGSTRSSSSRSRSSYSTARDGDIEIEIDPDGDAVRPGEIVEFDIDLRNRRNSRVTTDVVATFDSDLDFLSASDDGDEISRDEVEWQDIRVGARDTETLTLRMRVRSGARIGRSLHLTVEANGTEEEVIVVTSSRSRRNDDNCDDDYDDDCDLRSNGDVEVRITSTPDPFEPGEQVRYTIKIENLEDYDRRVDVRANLDPDTTYVSGTDNPDHSSRRVEWENLKLEDGDTRTLTLVVYTDRDIDDGDEITLTIDVNGREEDEEVTEARFR